MIHVRNQMNSSPLMSVLNANVVTDSEKRETLRTMGLSACQVGCMGRQIPTHHCSAH